MKPVEIEFLMKDRLTGGLTAAGQSVDSLGRKVEDTGRRMDTAFRDISKLPKKELSNYVEEYKRELDSLYATERGLLQSLESAKLGNPIPGTTRDALREQLVDVGKDLEAATQRYNELRAAQDNYKASSSSLRTQIYAVREELSKIKLENQQISASGGMIPPENIERARALEAELQRLGTAYRETTEQQKALTTGGTQMAGLVSGLQGVMGAYAVGHGVMSMFVSDSERLAKIQTKLQAVMSVMMGLQQVSNTLHSTSAFRITTVRKVTELWAVAQTKLTVALGGSAIAAKVLMGALTLGLSAAITGAVVLIEKMRSAQKKANEESKQFASDVGNSAASTLVKFERLNVEWDKLADKDRQKWVNENKKAFDDLGVSVSNVVDADKLFADQKDAFVESVMARAKAMAALEIATEKYKEAITLQLQADAMPENKIRTFSGLPVPIAWDTGKENPERAKALSESAKLTTEANSLIVMSAEESQKAIVALVNAGIKSSGNAKDNAEALRKLLKKLADDAAQTEVNAMGDSFAKRRAQAELNFKKEKEDLIRRREEIEKLQGASLNAVQGRQFKKLNDDAQRRRDAEVSSANMDEHLYWANLWNKEMKDWSEYLIKYGSFQERRIAITQKYNTLIEAAETGGERLSLSEQMKEELSGLELEAIEMSDDWKLLFGNLDNVTTKTLRSLIKKIRTVISTSTTLSIEDQKRLMSELDKITESVDKRNPFKSLKDSFEEYAKAKKADNANDQLKAANKMRDAFADIADYTTNIGSSLVSTMENFGVEVPAGIKGVIDGIDKVFSSIGDIDFTSPMSVIQGSVGAVEGLSIAVAGAMGAAEREAAESAEKMASSAYALINIYGELIRTQREWIETLSGQEATEAYQKELDLINKQVEASRKAGVDWLNAGASAGSHSYGYRLRRDLQGLSDDFNNLNLSVDWEGLGGRMTGLFNLSSEELTKLKTELPEFWAGLDENTRNYLQGVIDGTVSAEEAMTHFHESLSSLSFDSLKNGLDDLLKQTDLVFSDIQDSFEDHMSNAILNTIKNSILNDRLTQWYNDFSRAMEDGALSRDEAFSLRAEYERIVKEGNDRYNAALDAAGISGSGSNDVAQQSGKAGAFQTMSQDTGDELKGLFTSVQMHTSSIDDKLSQVVSLYAASDWWLEQIATNTGAAASATRELLEETKKMIRDGLKVK